MILQFKPEPKLTRTLCAMTTQTIWCTYIADKPLYAAKKEGIK